MTERSETVRQRGGLQTESSGDTLPPSEEGADSARVLVDDEDVGSCCEGCCGRCCVVLCAPERSACKVVGYLIAVTLAGILFGWALEKGRVFEPASIRGQMVFKRWIMLKMFLSAVATGQLALVLLSLLPFTKDKFQQAATAFVGCFGGKGVLTSALGPFIMGVGMTLSGACPGMVLAQIGSWTKNAIFTLVGVLLAALFYGMVEPLLAKLAAPKKPLKIHSVHEQFKISYHTVALPVALLIALVVFLLEYFIPWQKDLDQVNVNNNSTTNILLMRSWPPSASGSLIGVLQAVVVLTVADTLGGSSSYQTLVSQWVIGERLEQTFPYLAKYRYGIGNWWQVFYVGAAMIGACLSSLASGSLASTKGPTVATAIVGGFVLNVGARFASGCTSGHGLSGVGLLMWLSIVAVPFMFGGGIVTAFAMQATGALDDYSCYTQPCTGTV